MNYLEFIWEIKSNIDLGKSFWVTSEECKLERLPPCGSTFILQTEGFKFKTTPSVSDLVEILRGFSKNGINLADDKQSWINLNSANPVLTREVKGLRISHYNITPLITERTNTLTVQLVDIVEDSNLIINSPSSRYTKVSGEIYINGLELLGRSEQIFTQVVITGNGIVVVEEFL